MICSCETATSATLFLHPISFYVWMFFPTSVQDIFMLVHSYFILVLSFFDIVVADAIMVMFIELCNVVRVYIRVIDIKKTRLNKTSSSRPNVVSSQMDFDPKFLTLEFRPVFFKFGVNIGTSHTRMSHTDRKFLAIDPIG